MALVGKIPLDVKLFEIKAKMLAPGNPWEATDEQCAEAALDWANVLREEYGLAAVDKLPQGHPASPNSCVLSVAMQSIADGSCPLPEPDGRWSGGGARFSFEGQVVQRPIPELVQQFMWRFDAGRYPELVLPAPSVLGAYVASVPS